MNAQQLHSKAIRTPTLALQFLVWAGIVILPKYCPEGHSWKASGSFGYSCLHCRFRCPEEEGEEGPKRKWCNKKVSWRAKNSVVWNLWGVLKRHGAKGTPCCFKNENTTSCALSNNAQTAKCDARDNVTANCQRPCVPR